MPQVRFPRSGSLEFWPRKRSRRVFARVKTWVASKDAKLLGFSGYKVGMTHLIADDNRKTSTTKGMEIAHAATIIECPPLKAVSIRFYKNTQYGAKTVSEILAENFDKNLTRTLVLPKKKERKNVPENFDYIRLLVYTMPSLTGIGKKKPEVFEMGIGGNKEEQLKYAQEKLGREISVLEVFKEGQQIDIHGVSKGKGVQGPMKRFGIHRKQHKSEKGVRRVGSLGGWKSQGHIMWRVAKAGKMGYHVRTEHNKWILKISNNPNDMVKNGGFHNYGVIKNPFMLIKGSIIGPKKRIVRMNAALQPNKLRPSDAPVIKHIQL